MKAVALCEVTYGSAPIQGALDYLAVEKRYRIVGAALVAREVPPDFQLDVPFVSAPTAGAAIRQAAEAFEATVVIDLTNDEPEELFAWATEALHLGLEVHGADFRLWPPSARGHGKIPALAFFGGEDTSARVAAIAYFVRETRNRCKSAAVVMEPGAPPYPEVVEPYPAGREAAGLLAAFRDGHQIAAGHYRLAAIAGITAVGCSFTGPGLTGVPVNSAVPDGVLLAGETGADILLLAGSGQAIPPAAVKAGCFLGDIGAAPRSFDKLPWSYQIKEADYIIAAGYEATPPAAPCEALRNTLKAAGIKAPFVYACLEPATIGPEPEGDTLVITARLDEERAALASFWNKRGRARVIQVCGAEDCPPRGEAGRLCKQGAVTAMLDLAVPNLGPWLVYFDRAGVAIRLYHDILKPARALAGALLDKAGWAGPGATSSSP